MIEVVAILGLRVIEQYFGGLAQCIKKYYKIKNTIMEYTSCGRTCYTRTFKMKLKGQSHYSFTIQKKKSFTLQISITFLKLKILKGKKLKKNTEGCSTMGI